MLNEVRANGLPHVREVNCAQILTALQCARFAIADHGVLRAGRTPIGCTDEVSLEGALPSALLDDPPAHKPAAMAWRYRCGHLP